MPDSPAAAPRKFAPAREDGAKPYVVERTEWARTTERIVYAESARTAEYVVKGRQLYVYAKARRATVADMERLNG